MSGAIQHDRPRASGTRQNGIALAVALVLLVIVAMIGLAAVSNTIMQNKMSANQYDREIAFQSAATALRIAENYIRNHPDVTAARNCADADTQCPADPFSDTSLTPTSINSDDLSAGAGTTQYIIEDMGRWTNAKVNNGYDQTANAAQNGQHPHAGKVHVYRITARSGEPDSDRAVVTLQVIFKEQG